MSDKIKKKHSGKDYSLFLIPSLIGILLFMVPFKYQGDFTIPVAMLSNAVAGFLEPALPLIITALITITGILTIIYKAAKPSFMEKSKEMKGLFDVNVFWFVVRILGMVFVILTYLDRKSVV